MEVNEDVRLFAIHGAPEESGWLEWGGGGLLFSVCRWDLWEMKIATFHTFPCVAEHFAGFSKSPADSCFSAVGDGSDI